MNRRQTRAVSVILISLTLILTVVLWRLERHSDEATMPPQEPVEAIEGLEDAPDALTTEPSSTPTNDARTGVRSNGATSSPTPTPRTSPLHRQSQYLDE